MATTKPTQSLEWFTEEDFNKDLWEYSDISVPKDFKPVKPPTLIEWYNRVSKTRNKSLFDDEVPNADKSAFMSGRGRGGRNLSVSPGIPVESHPREMKYIQNKLRGVSGIGHSNQFIEGSIRITPTSPIKRLQKKEMTYVDDSTTSASSVNSSPVSIALISDSDDDQCKPLLPSRSKYKLLKPIKDEIIESELSNSIDSLSDKKNSTDSSETTSATSESSSSDVNSDWKSTRRCRGRGSARQFAQ